jgi:hypothetical protein
MAAVAAASCLLSLLGSSFSPPLGWAQGMMEAAPEPSAGSSWRSPEMMLPESGGTPAAPSLPPLPKSHNELTLPSVTSQQASIPAPPKSDNTKVIPVIPQDQEVLVLPQASRDFLGQWGGKLTLVNRVGEDFNPPEHNIVDLVFGERNGQVVMGATIFGNPNSQVLQTKAEAEGPTEVTLEVSGMELGADPPLRHVEKMKMELAADNLVRCTKRVDFYVPGFSRPVNEAVYEGTLRPLTVGERRRLTRDLESKDLVPRARIDQGNPPPDPLE